MSVNARAQEDVTLPFREAASQGNASLLKYIAQHYQGVGWKTDYILKQMMSTEDFYASEIVQVKIPTLYKGRFVLVGRRRLRGRKYRWWYESCPRWRLYVGWRD